MNRQDRMEIFRAINNVSKRQNEMEQKLDEVMQMLNAQANDRINADDTAIDDIAGIVSMYDQAIDELATLVAESGVE